ncbi:hypothetical protein THASP1DRAFT_27636 [Thamnocephalis sphaerospora]|uniref:Uncharacterized protein n=1 Tax=Thamnocephalis sphaerospora TaxID=78915 RepID=A0A4P9XY20_9FUNG|nr:hypothetical protein THASP1DRAFT_27636 [Thamnocephalis sphaerospora]|eukprot:RKP10581.1 hypothetical protein THASP1DRAFT_27636 [Thamnocephalis sphaerospora]
MGRWSQSAHEDELLRKVKTLFQNAADHVLRDHQHEFNFEAFVASLDENDRGVRRLFEGLLKETHRSYRKSRARSSPYPDTHGRARAQHMMGRPSIYRNLAGASSSASLHQLMDALGEDVAALPITSPPLEDTFGYTADEMSDWIEGGDGSANASEEWLLPWSVRRASLASQPDHNGGGPPAGALHANMRNWRQALMNRAVANNNNNSNNIGSASGAPATTPAFEDEMSASPMPSLRTAAPARSGPGAPSSFIRALSRLGAGPSAPSALDGGGSLGLGGSRGASPRIGNGEANPIAIAAAAAASRHPLVMARRRSAAAFSPNLEHTADSPLLGGGGGGGGGGGMGVSRTQAMSAGGSPAAFDVFSSHPSTPQSQPATAIVRRLSQLARSRQSLDAATAAVAAASASSSPGLGGAGGGMGGGTLSAGHTPTMAANRNAAAAAMAAVTARMLARRPLNARPSAPDAPPIVVSVAAEETGAGVGIAVPSTGRRHSLRASGDRPRARPSPRTALDMEAARARILAMANAPSNLSAAVPPPLDGSPATASTPASVPATAMSETSSSHDTHADTTMHDV